MGALVKALVLRPIVREKMRTLLTLLGIAVGVAVVVAIALSNQSALRAFRESVDAVAGRANWQIAADSDLDEDVLLRLQPLWPRGRRRSASSPSTSSATSTSATIATRGS
jgi:putative ABC transport system permease protein